MTKYLILAFLLAGQALAGTLYPVSSTSLDSVYNGTDGQDGLGRLNRHILVPATNVWIIAQGSGGLSPQSDITTFNGSAWASNTGVWNSSSGYDGLLQSGDSVFALGNNDAYAVITKIVGVTVGTTPLDTICQTATGRLAYTTVGSAPESLMAMIRTEAGATDYTYAYLSDGAISSSSSYTLFDTITLGQAGMRAWEKGRLIYYMETDNDLCLLTREGLDTVSTAFFSGSFSTPSSSYHLQYYIAIWNDTVWAAWSRGDSAYIKRAVDTGSYPNRYLKTIDSQKVWTADDLPSPVTTNLTAGYMFTWPEISFTRIGTHTYALSKHWADQANLDSIDVMISEFSSGTWGAWSVFEPAVNGYAIWRLHTPPTVPGTSGAITVPILWADSVGVANRDSAYVYAGTVTLSTPGTPTTAVLNRVNLGRVQLRFWSEAWREE
jgi:hypothetical protein